MLLQSIVLNKPATEQIIIIYLLFIYCKNKSKMYIQQYIYFRDVNLYILVSASAPKIEYHFWLYPKL